MDHVVSRILFRFLGRIFPDRPFRSPARSLLFVLLLLIGAHVIGAHAHAQGAEVAPAMTEETILGAITAVEAGEGDQRVVQVDRGTADGWRAGLRGACLAAYATARPDRPTGTIGTAEILAVTDDTATVRVTRTKGQPGWPVVPGDAIECPARVPRLPERSALWPLVRDHIDLLSVSGKTVFCDYRTLYSRETPELARAIAGQMLDDIHQAGADFADDARKAPFTRGPYAGKTLRQVMEGAREEDLHAFFLYLEEFTGKYLNHRWKISEIFATWVLHDAPWCAATLRDALLAEKDAARQAALIANARQEILRQDWLTDWTDTAQAWSRAGRFTEARALAGLTERAARQLQRPAAVAWALFTRAYIENDARRYLDSLQAYGVALAAFTALKVQDDDALRGAAVCQYNRASISYRLTRYHDAVAAYGAALATYRRRKNPGRSMGLCYEGLGNCAYTRKDYTAALRQYRLALAAYTNADSANDAADMHRWSGICLSYLGRGTEAEARFREALARYRALSDRTGETRVRLNLGSHYWRLGRYQEALADEQAALALYREQQDDAGISATCIDIGKLYWNLGQYADALSALDESLRRRRAQQDDAGIAEALYELGSTYQASGEYPRALQSCQDARAIYRRLQRTADEARTLVQLGVIYDQLRQYETALQQYNAAIGIYRKAVESAGLAGALAGRALIRSRLKNYPGALADYQEALTLRQALGNRSEQADTLLDLGVIHLYRQENAKARQSFEQALTVAQAIGNRVQEAKCHRYLGQYWQTSFQFPQAYAEYGRALAILRDPGVRDATEQVSTLLLLGQAYQHQGNYREAKMRQEEALALARQAHARASEQEALENMAWVESSLGNQARALELFQQALQLAREVRNDWALGSTYGDISVLFSDTGDSARAIEYGEKALALFRELRNDYGICNELNALGVYYYRQGDFPRAERYLRESLTLARSLGDRAAMEYALGNLGELAARTGRLIEAGQRLQQSLAISREIGKPGKIVNNLQLLARVSRLQGEALAARGDPKGAAVQFAAAAVNLAACRVQLDRLQSPWLRIDWLMEQAALASARRDYPPAIAALTDARRQAEALQAPFLLWEILARLAAVQAAQGELRTAVTTYRESVQVIEALTRRVAGGKAGQEVFQRSIVSVYEQLAELLGRLSAQVDDPAEKRRLAEDALQYLARGRFQMQQETMRGVTDTGNAALDTALQRYDDTLANRTRLENEKQKALTEGNQEKAGRIDKIIATNEDQLAACFTDIRAIDPDMDSRLKFDPRRMSETIAALPEHATLLVFFPGQDSLHCWIYTRDGIKAWRQHTVRRDELYRLVQGFRGGIDDIIQHVQRRERIGRGFGPAAEENADNPAWYRENIRGLRATLSQLYDHLIRPVETELGTADPLLILPYGQLCYLPFETLISGTQDGGCRFFGQGHTLAYYTSEQHIRDTLALLPQPAPTGDDVWVAFADPRGQLGSSLEEAQEIAPLFARSEIHTKTAGNAAKDNVLQLREDCTILHFATHGFLNGSKPSQTFLELDTPPGDGMLSQAEIWPRLKNSTPAFKQRHVRMVILSACETARAQQAPEAEVLGMPDAFTLAGAPTVMASLWSVYTYTTTDYMIEFYHQLVKEKAGKALAAQRARNALLLNEDGRYAHPFYWAPFLLFGDWR